MKKAVLLITLLGLALTLMAAAPPDNASVVSSSSSFCVDRTTGRHIPCGTPPKQPGVVKIKIPGQGEPTMEKVGFYYYLVGSPKLWVPGFWRYFWKSGYQFIVVGKYGCASWFWWVGTFKMPVGCAFRYQY